MSSQEAIRLNEKDNVLVLPFGGEKGDRAGEITLTGDVPAGYKVAARTIGKGERVVKYGRAIGIAKRDIAAGEWVHEHNLETGLGTESEDFPPRYGANAARADYDGQRARDTFMGYCCAHGRPGVRNDLWVIPTVGCVNGELRAIVRDYRKPEWIDNVKVLEHPYGCSQLGDDLDHTKRALAGLASNPNAAGVLLVGLGCENLQLPQLLEAIEYRSNLRTLVMQEEDAAKIPLLLGELAANAPRSREAFPLSELCVGVKCGGSDGYSGLTANPLVGRFADFLTEQGGTILATEIPEMFGAETEIVSRIRSEEEFRKFIETDQ